MIKKVITNHGMTLEVGDFYGGGPDEVISSMVEEGTKLTINTSCGSYDVTLKPGDYLLDVEGNGKVLKSKFDKEEGV